MTLCALLLFFDVITVHFKTWFYGDYLYNLLSQVDTKFNLFAYCLTIPTNIRLSLSAHI